MDESLKHDANLENLESTFGNSDYSSFDAGQSRIHRKESETIGNRYQRPACLNNTHLVILAIKNSPSFRLSDAHTGKEIESKMTEKKCHDRLHTN